MSSDRDDLLLARQTKHGGVQNSLWVVLVVLGIGIVLPRWDGLWGAALAKSREHVAVDGPLFGLDRRGLHAVQHFSNRQNRHTRWHAQ